MQWKLEQSPMDISNLPTFSWFYSKIRKNPHEKEALTCFSNKLKTLKKDVLSILRRDKYFIVSLFFH